jgi:4-diphosphocytidyl-2-C-methyl-D-erythritol kinase
VRMSGSGATCFALLDKADSCAVALDAVHAIHPRWWAMASRIKA